MPDTPDTHTHACVSGGKKCSFFGKFGVLCFFITSDLRFADIAVREGKKVATEPLND